MSQTKQSISVEIDDNEDIAMGANYGLSDPCAPINPQPGFRYYAAADDGDNSRPDGIARVKQMGYEVCTEETCLSTDCKLMRIPLDKWEARQRQMQRASDAASKANMTPAGIPDESGVVMDGHGRRTRKQ